METLRFDPKFLERVLDGEKEITVRRGNAEKYAFREGDAVAAEFPGRAVLLARITDMRFTTLNEVTEQEAQDDGYFDVAELMDVLREYYPDAEWTDPAVVIRFNRLTGAP